MRKISDYSKLCKKHKVGFLTNHQSFFFHERLPNLSNIKNKSFFHRKIANSFCLKDFAIFHKKNAYSLYIKISQSFKKIQFAIFHENSDFENPADCSIFVIRMFINRVRRVINHFYNKSD